MSEFIAAGLGALLFVAVVGWRRAVVEAREWQTVCATLGNEYDKLFVEACRRTQAPDGTWQKPKPRGAWLN